jgi:hypothetical protein
MHLVVAHAHFGTCGTTSRVTSTSSSTFVEMMIIIGNIVTILLCFDTTHKLRWISMTRCLQLNVKYAMKIDVIRFVTDLLRCWNFVHLSFSCWVAKLNQLTLLNGVSTVILEGIYNLVTILQ